MSRPGIAQFILNILISCMNRPTVRMHRLMGIFVISRFQTTFSREMTVVSEIYCQNLRDKTSILSFRQIIKMCYCRIHAHVHAWTAPWLNTFFSTCSELSYKSNKNVWAYSETQIDLLVSPTVWSGFALLITASVSAQSDHFSLSTQQYFKRFKNPLFVDSGSKHCVRTRGTSVQADRMCLFFGVH